MMPEEWPIAVAPADQPNAPARDAVRDRLTTVRVDFFLDPAARLTEQERALMTAMLHCLIGDLADEVRAALPDSASAANDDSNLALIETLTSARLLDHPGLMALLLRRADEERIATAAKARIGRREARVLQGLVSHESGAISASAMALILARGRRRDRFGQCLVNFDDLPAEVAAALLHAVSAALRRDLVSTRGIAEADRLLATATEQVVARHEPENGIDALTEILVELLDEEGELSDDLIVAAAVEGEMTFVAHALSQRAGLSGDVAMEELLSGSNERAMTLLRVAGVDRDAAASLLAGVGDLLGVTDPGRAIAAFDGMSQRHVEDARSWLTTDKTYKSAVTALGDGHGQRSL